MKPSRNIIVYCPMSVVRNIAGIAKGMSITFREALNPTEVENYPDGPGPLRGAVLEARYRGAHVLAARRKRPGEVRGLLPVRRGVPRQLHLH